MNKKILVILPFVFFVISGCSKNKANETPTPTPKIHTYTVTWVDYNGEVLEIDSGLHQGDMPQFDGEIPDRDGDAQYTYTFNRWVPEISPVDRDITYTATYSSSINNYDVVWRNWDGEILKEEHNVPYGTAAYFGMDEPTRPDDTVGQEYVFDHWDPEPARITGSTEFTAVYRSRTKAYIITWKNWNGKTLKTDVYVPHGTTPTYTGTTPTRPDDTEYTYTFTGWTPEIVPAVGNATYTAVFSQNSIE